MGYFFHEFKNEALNKAYELLENVTPFKFDCGTLCGSKCCKGGDGSGMLLFPGEEIFFRHRNGFTVRKDPATGYDEVICTGKCNRSDRPLACRIFPLFVYSVKKNGKTFSGIAPDTRARGVCPLCDCGINYSKEFERRLRIISKIFENDSEICNFLIDLSHTITDFGVFSGTQLQ